MHTQYADRRESGRLLGEQLEREVESDALVVLGLPRGGVPVAFEVARALGAPLDVFAVRKLGVPGHEELAMGAIASGDVCVLNEDVVRRLEIDEAQIQSVIEREKRELDRREELYRGGREPVAVEGRTAILVDDGLATGATMRAAVEALRERGAERIVVAVPVAAAEICAAFERVADAVVCLRTPEMFMAVGQWYRDFSPTTDEEVRELLAEAQAGSSATHVAQPIPPERSRP